MGKDMLYNRRNDGEGKEDEKELVKAQERVILQE
jgi:hypothetical protein